MYTQKEFAVFLDNYKKRLAKTDDLFKEAKNDYRVRKLTVLYCLYDKVTFGNYLRSNQGRKYVEMAKYILITIKGHNFYSSVDVNKVANALLDKYFFAKSIEEVCHFPEIEEGVYKMFCDYIGRKKIDMLDEIEVDMSSLEFV